MTVQKARKIHFVNPESLLRGFVDADAGGPNTFVYLKDSFQVGAHSEVFVGAKNGELRIFKSVHSQHSATSPGWRKIIADEKARIARSKGREPNPLPWYQQGTMDKAAIEEEVTAVRACKSPFAQQTDIRATSRRANGRISKYFYIMPPAPTDLLGCVHALENAPTAMRRNVALMALKQLSEQLYDWHIVQHRTHRDLRSENVLCNQRDDGTSEVLLWDFGCALTGDEASIEAGTRKDMQDLGKVITMLLVPELRPRLGDSHLLDAIDIVCERFDDLTPILAGLLDPNPHTRWTARDLAKFMHEHPPEEAPEANVRTFMPSVHQNRDSIDEKWTELQNALESEAPWAEPDGSIAYLSDDD